MGAAQHRVPQRKRWAGLLPAWCQGRDRPSTRSRTTSARPCPCRRAGRSVRPRWRQSRPCGPCGTPLRTASVPPACISMGTMTTLSASASLGPPVGRLGRKVFSSTARTARKPCHNAACVPLDLSTRPSGNRQHPKPPLNSQAPCVPPANPPTKNVVVEATAPPPARESSLSVWSSHDIRAGAWAGIRTAAGRVRCRSGAFVQGVRVVTDARRRRSRGFQNCSYCTAVTSICSVS